MSVPSKSYTQLWYGQLKAPLVLPAPSSQSTEPAVPTHVVESPNDSVLAVHGKNPSPGDLAREVVARVGHLLDPTDAEPASSEDRLALALPHRIVVVVTSGQTRKRSVDGYTGDCLVEHRWT